MNAQQAKAQRARAVRELNRDQKQQARDRIKELRARLKHARGQRARRVREARESCRRARRSVREKAKVIRARHRQAAQDEIVAARAVATGTCQVAATQALQRAAQSAQRAGAALDAERAYQAQVLRASKRKPHATKADVARAARERAHESDDQVAVNLPPELLPVWRERAPKTKPTDRATRTEVFLDWVHNHSSDVARIISRDVDRQIADLEREQRAAGRALRRRGPVKVRALNPDPHEDPAVKRAYAEYEEAMHTEYADDETAFKRYNRALKKAREKRAAAGVLPDSERVFLEAAPF